MSFIVAPVFLSRLSMFYIVFYCEFVYCVAVKSSLLNFTSLHGNISRV